MLESLVNLIYFLLNFYVLFVKDNTFSIHNYNCQFVKFYLMWIIGIISNPDSGMLIVVARF